MIRRPQDEPAIALGTVGGLLANGVGMDPVEPIIHSFIVKVWQEVVVGDADQQPWRGYITHVPSGTRRYFEDLDAIAAFVEPQLATGLGPIRRETEDPDPDHTVAPGDVGPPAVPEMNEQVERSAPRVSGPTPAPQGVDMDSSPNGLQALQKALQKGDTAIDEAEKLVGSAQTDLKRQRDAQAALQKTVEEARATNAAIEKQVAASVGPSATARKALGTIVDALATTLTDEQRAAIQAVVDKVDADVDEIRRQRDEAQVKADAAQATANGADKALSAAAEVLARAQAALKDLPTALQTRTVEATKLAATAKAALDGGHAGAAHVLARRLERSLDALDHLSQPDQASSLFDAVGAAWAKVAAARAAANDKADEAATAEAALQKLDDDLKSIVAKRESLVNDGVADLEKQWAAKMPAEPAEPARPAEPATPYTETPPSGDKPEAGASTADVEVAAS